MPESPTQTTSEAKLRKGYVAIFDLLGWKGIWRRHDLGAVMQSVNVLRAVAAEVERQAAAMFQPVTPEALALVVEKWWPVVAEHGEEAVQEFRTRVASMELPDEPMLRVESIFLSDTLVLGSWTPDVWHERIHEHMGSVHRMFLCSAIARVERDCAAASVPLMFRGTIASGEFLFDQHLILGQAVDDAAELMDHANAAIVWFVPPGFTEPEDRQTGQYLDYAVPLHDGRHVWAQAVNPFFGCYDREEIERTFARMLQAFGDSTTLDLVIKKQNTALFLSHARDRWLAYLGSPRGREILAAMEAAKRTRPSSS